MLLSNHCVRREESLLFNDQIMYSLSIMGIYAISCLGRPLLAAVFFTFSMSIKAGTILYMPAFLGVVQYRFGIGYLIISIIIILNWQYIVAKPYIVDGETTLIDYINMSKLLGGNGKGEPGWGAQ